MIFSISPRSGLTTVTPMWPTGSANAKAIDKVRRGVLYNEQQNTGATYLGSIGP